MKNITVSVDEETYRRSRVKAAEEGTTVSAVVREYLTGYASGRVSDEEFKRLEKLQNDVLARIDVTGKGFRASDRLPREELYRRDALS